MLYSFVKLFIGIFHIVGLVFNLIDFGDHCIALFLNQALFLDTWLWRVGLVLSEFNRDVFNLTLWFHLEMIHRARGVGGPRSIRVQGNLIGCGKRSSSENRVLRLQDLWFMIYEWIVKTILVKMETRWSIAKRYIWDKRIMKRLIWLHL
jgi:hypothetical protein